MNDPLRPVRAIDSRPGQWRGRIAAAAGGIAVLVVIVGFLAFRSDQASKGAIQALIGSPTPTVSPAGPLASLLVRDGSRVRAVGMVVAAPGMPIQLCRTNPGPTVNYLPGEEPPPTCSHIAVALVGFETNSVPSWTTRQGVGFTGHDVAIQGVWQGGAINVTDVADGTVGEESPPIAVATCSAPPGGWVLDEFASGNEFESAKARLYAVVSGSPDVYGGWWVAHPGALDGPQVQLVSTVRNPEEVNATLRAAYPGNLCIEQVEQSATQLKRIAQRLETTALRAWVVSRPDLDRVELRIAAFDDRAAASLGADAPAILVEPMVRPD